MIAEDLADARWRYTQKRTLRQRLRLARLNRLMRRDLAETYHGGKTEFEHCGLLAQLSGHMRAIEREFAALVITLPPQGPFQKGRIHVDPPIEKE